MDILFDKKASSKFLIFLFFFNFILLKIQVEGAQLVSEITVVTSDSIFFGVWRSLRFTNSNKASILSLECSFKKRHATVSPNNQFNWTSTCELICVVVKDPSLFFHLLAPWELIFIYTVKAKWTCNLCSCFWTLPRYYCINDQIPASLRDFRFEIVSSKNFCISIQSLIYYHALTSLQLEEIGFTPQKWKHAVKKVFKISRLFNYIHKQSI